MNFVYTMNIYKQKYKIFSILCIIGVFTFLSFVHLPQSARAGTENNTTTVRITDEGFTPSFVEIREGDTILFENISSRNIWPASNTHPTHALYPGSDVRKCGTDEERTIFDACRELKPGDTYSFVFTETGTWRYHDHLFSNMGGEIVVQQEEGGIVKTKLQLPRLSSLEWIKIIVSKTYFSIFPLKLSSSIETVDFFEVVKNPKKLLFWMKMVGYDRVMDELVADSFRGDVGGTRVAQCHTQGHYVGRMTYQLYGAEIFENGVDERCQFGFYHGLLELFIGNPESDDVAPYIAQHDIARRCSDNQESIIFQMFCEHGMGHGLMVYYDYNLPLALEKCQELGTLATIELCYHGVFMENIFAELGFAIGHDSAWADQSRINFPCDELERREYDAFVVSQCYFGQPLLWGWANSSSYFNSERAIEGCMRAPSYARVKCFAGLGFAAADASASLTDEQLIEICKQAPGKEAQENCLARVLWVRSMVWNLSLNFWNPVICSFLGRAIPQECNKFVRSFFSRFFER